MHVAHRGDRIRDRELLRVAAELSGERVDHAEDLLAILLQRPKPRRGSLGRSTLNNDGSPMQVCISVDRLTRTVRLVGDPGAGTCSTSESLAAAGRAVSMLSSRNELFWVDAFLSTMLATLVPPAVAYDASRASGTVWLASPLSNHGMAIYVKAFWSGDSDDWARCRRLMRQLLPHPFHAEKAMADLMGDAYPVSVALETSSVYNARLKLYWRLRRPRALHTFEIGLFSDPTVSQFLVEALKERTIAPTGLVLSAGFSLTGGDVTDIKIDICGHCLDRKPEALLELLNALTRRHGLFSAELEQPLCQRRAELAFLGFGIDRRREPRLNVYLKSPSRYLKPAGRTAHRDRASDEVRHG
jgi:hypothetical protein